MTLTGSTGKSSDAYIKKLNEEGQRHAHEYLFKHNTWYKTLTLQFHKPHSKAEFNELLPNNTALQESYKKIIFNVDITGDMKLVEAAFRTHTTISLKALYNVISTMMESRKNEFLKYGFHVYRLVVDKGHEFYQAPDETFPWVTKLVNYQQKVVDSWKDKRPVPGNVSNALKALAPKAFAEKGEGIDRRNRMAGAVRSQDGYTRYVY